MIPVPNGAKVWLALGRTDMQRGMRSLALLVQQALNKDVHAGEGISLSLSTLADQIGAVGVAARPWFLLIEAQVLAAERLHRDATTLPWLAKDKTDVARIWDYVRDGRPFGGPVLPAVLCYYSRTRKGEHPRGHLAGYTGILQVDRYAGFNDMFRDDWANKPMTPANCWPASTSAASNCTQNPRCDQRQKLL